MNWHDYARQFRKCYVENDGGMWVVYLPDGLTRRHASIDVIREMAWIYRCTIIL